MILLSIVILSRLQKYFIYYTFVWLTLIVGLLIYFYTNLKKFLSTMNRRKIIYSLLNVFQLLYYFPFRYNRTYLSFQLSTTLYILLRAHVFDQPSISVHLLAWVFDMIGTALPKQTRNRDNRQPYTWKIQYTNPKPRKACIY